MTPIEDLVRQALAETPTPVTASDPIAALDRRVRKARRFVAAGAGLAAAAVVAAIVVPLVVLGGSGSSKLAPAVTPTPTASPPAHYGLQPIEVWDDSGTVAVASGDAGLWALSQAATSTHETYALHQYDPSSGDVIGDAIDVPGPVSYIAVGLGRVWTFGGGDGAYGELSQINRLDPATGQITSLSIHGAGAPSSMVFTAQSAFVSLAAANKVVNVGGMTGSLNQSQPVSVPGQPTSMVVMDDGTVWVNESLANKWAHLDVADGKSTVLGTVDWGRPMMGRSTHQSVWTSDSRLIEINPESLSVCVSCAYGHRIQTPGRPFAVAPTDTGGIFVATSGAGPKEGIAYYTAQAVEQESTEPTSFLPDAAVLWMAADPSGGVVWVDEDGSLRHWDPTAAASTR